MAIRLEVIEEAEALHSLANDWQEMADEAGVSPLFRGPRWLLSWWRAYQRQLGAELFLLAVYDDDRLVGLAPFYKRHAKRSPSRKLEEVRLMGDAGPRPPTLGILAAPGYEEKVGVALADYLASHAGDWDVLDLEPLEEPEPARAHMVSRLASKGRPVDSSSAGGVWRIELQATGSDEEETPRDKRASAYVGEAGKLRKGLAILRRLSRLEWAHREEASPFADRQAIHLLEDIALPLGQEGKARLARLDDVDGQAVAAALIIDDGGRSVVLALAVDPETGEAGPRLLAAEAFAARKRGLRSLEISEGATEHGLPQMPTTQSRAVQLSVFGTSSAASLARTYGKVRRKMHVAKDAPVAAAAGARAAWSKIRTAAANVAGLERLQLYRGELWTRGVSNAPGLTIELFTETDFGAMEASDRELFLEGLHLDEGQIRKAWQHDDLAVLARLNERPAGISWCSCKRVLVPEIERHLAVGPGEAYIHDIFVAPSARGRSLAPSMLEHLATVLRQRDIYKSWALIGSNNIASVRAFEKAAYTAVAEVVHARIGGADKLVVRPPDVDAKKLLGL
ncbi:MAG: GNAT family N-acetyltransferase [Myxococcales bacterium]|nr:GNAT family N-acetyltransferase [Myxococcales bacterium]